MAAQGSGFILQLIHFCDATLHLLHGNIIYFSALSRELIEGKTVFYLSLDS